MNIQKPLAFGRPTALLLSRRPTEYVNIRQRECPNKCCSGENEHQIPPPAPLPILPPAPAPISGQNGRKMESKLGTFPVDLIRDSYYGQNNSNDSALFAPYYFHENPAAAGSGQQSTTANGEFEENERNDEGFHSNSNDSSTQSLLLWRRKQTTNFSNQSNGTIFRLEQKSRYSTPWWSSNENSSLAKSNLRLNLHHNSSLILAKNGQKSAQKCCLFSWLIGALLLLSICLLFLTVILIVQQQIELQQKLMNTQEPYSRLLSENLQNQNDTGAQMAAMLNGSRIRENLNWIAAKVHVAGTIEQLELMDKLAEQYNSLGFDVRKYEYSDVLLSMPDYSSPNMIHGWNERTLRWEEISTGIGELPKNAKIDSKLMEQLENDKRMNVWWNAYSQNGTVLGELVYANYGTQEDFSMLEKVNISVAGKITLIRYGGIFRGDKVHLAERLGAIGVILYSDPFDYVPGNKTFPNDLWLPPSGSQRGTLYRSFGDPQTPFLPSLPYAHREFGEEKLRSQGILPNIPVTSIGYGDAQKIFARLDGPPVQWSRWAGSLPVIYRLSGSLLLRLDVNTQNRRGIIKNFIAKIEGREEPDRWILLGNHADAWTKGSIDPGTGTSIMLEMARVFGEYSKLSGWRPRRTIVFCQWDGEEFGLIGSTEWVEQNLGLLQSRAVAYINVDNLNGNTTLSVKAVPLLYRLIVDAAMSKIDIAEPLFGDVQNQDIESDRRVPQPAHSELKNGRRTLLDSWRFHNPRSILPGDRSVPYFQFPHSGSDFQPFISYAGIPVADLRMENVPYSYMLYHTAYEVPWLNERFLDPKWETAKAFAHFWLEIIRQLADNMIIPFNVEDYGIALAEYIAKMDAQMKLIGIVDAIGQTFYEEKLKYLQNAVQKFQKFATQFQRIIQAVNAGEKPISLLQREQINNRLLALERCFLWQNGIREWHRGGAFRHILFSAPEEEQNSGSSLPIFLDPAARWFSKIKSNSSAERENELTKIPLAFGQIQFCVECAEEMLKDIESEE